MVDKFEELCKSLERTQELYAKAERAKKAMLENSTIENISSARKALDELKISQAETSALMKDFYNNK